jgi:hypothetical protein
VVKMTSIRIVLSLVDGLDIELEQLDVKTVFFHSDLKERSIWCNQKDLK